MTEVRWQLVLAASIGCSLVYGLGLVLAWWDGVRIDRLVLLVLGWLSLLALCVWLYRRRSE